jgi:signal transduction histidine kinase
MERAIKVLVVEDRLDDAELVLIELRAAGFDVEAQRVDTERDLNHALDAHRWDVIISDFAMPGFDGLRAFEIVKARSLDVPFIFVSGALGEERAVEAMRAGARDYILKGNLRRLPVAVRRELDAAENVRNKRAVEAAFVRSERRYRTIFASTSTALVELDLSELAALMAVNPYASSDAIVAAVSKARVIDANAAALTLFEANEPSELGPRVLTVLLPAILELGVRAEATNAMSHPVEVEIRIDQPGGRPRLFIAAARTPHSSAEWADVVFSVFDITERRALEARLHTAERMEAIGRLAGGVAHDFNNLLTIIGASAELVRDELVVGDPKADDIDVILQSVAKAASLTGQLLAFSRKRPRRPEFIDLDLVIEETEMLVRRLIGEHIQIVLELAGGDGAVLADPTQLEQILMNLCSNARDAMPAGGTLSISTQELVVPEGGDPSDPNIAPGAYVVLQVADTGIGMDSETRARLFEPFFTKKVGKGTGLGLATVQGIVEQSGATIALRSAPGEGSTLRIYFPRHEGQARSRPRGDRQAAVRRDREATVLVVEDEDMLRAALRRLLERGGYHVIDAPDAKAALQLLGSTERQIDLLLTDVVMPGMNGYDLAQCVLAYHADARVLLVSGYHDEVTAHEDADTNFATLEKPFTGPALLARIRALLAVQ